MRALGSLLSILGGIIFIFGLFAVCAGSASSNGNPSTVSTLACGAIPFGLLVGYGGVSMTRHAVAEGRHREQIRVQEQQLAMMQQAAMAQTAQAQIQFAQFQQSQPTTRQQATLPPPMDESTLRAQMQAARALIEAKQYTQARALLQTIPHPTAREWIAKLDQRGV